MIWISTLHRCMVKVRKYHWSNSLWNIIQHIEAQTKWSPFSNPISPEEIDVFWLKNFLRSHFNNITALIERMAWHETGNKPLVESVMDMITDAYTHHTALRIWWCHQMETVSMLLGLCEGNPPVTGEVFFDLCLNKRLSKQSKRWWFEMS